MNPIDLFIPINAAAENAAAILARYITRPSFAPPTKLALSLMALGCIVLGLAYASAFLGYRELTSWIPWTRPALAAVLCGLAASAYLGGDYRNERR